ncbi:outer membrane protein assembly factor BamB family protein [Rubinisphaera margarita]|uniref:outer membrane protein assembly factor BamB family protein n=1 Tax=Rubinisphaera margarita TaxID=2909586 RepID=UPI001EE79B6C|nr:PQQ-binding-like beta-propeller repeat protein [Rubinisphaera margarita]MCG6156283.1 PQQ-binding-like beta-propeller repeat protein [Rubinisphaera margarita]
MAYLEIHLDDTTRQQKLARKEPVTIGRHTSNTVVVDDESVPLLLARVLWNKKARRFEVSAASEEDLLIGGKAIRSKILKDKDEITYGRFKAVYFDVDESVDIVPMDEAEDDLDEIDKTSAVVQEETVGPEGTPSASEGEETQPSDAPGMEPEAAEGTPDVKPEKVARKTSAKSLAAVKLARPDRQMEDESVKAWLTRSRRPGERDAVRSPLTTTLTIVGFILVIAAGGFYLLIGRQTAQLAYQDAKDDREQRKYAQAIAKYEQFLSDYPSHKLAKEARVELAFSRIDRQLSGAGASLEGAIAATNSFIDQFRNNENFRDWYPLLSTYAMRIAQDGYRQASRTHDPQFLELGDQGRQLFVRFKATDGSNDNNEAEIETARRTALADLLEYDVLQESLARLDSALKKKDAPATFQVFREAVARYPSFAERNELVTRVRSALGIEQTNVKTVEAPSEPAVVDDQSSTPGQQVFLIDLQRNRPDVTSDETPVWYLADGGCTAVDRMTGQPRWRIETGEPLAFEPIGVETRFACWLLPVDDGFGVALVRRADGEVQWRRRFPAGVLTEPTVTENTVFVTTDDRRMTAIQLETGETVRSLEFPQQISAPVTVLDSRSLCCVGTQDVLYFIDRQTWECSEVRYLGHAPGTVTLRPLTVADVLLTTEKDQLRSSRIRVLRWSEKQWNFEIVQSQRLPGIALGHPVLWGDRLFVEMNGPQIAAWQLSDNPADPFLRRITNASVPYSADVRLYLKPFEGDRLLVAGEDLRTLTLLTSAFDQSKSTVDLGRSTQSLQTFAGNSFAAGRKDPRIGSTLLHYNFLQDETYWVLSTSMDPVAVVPRPDPSQAPFCIDFNGRLFDVGRASNGPYSMVTPTESIFAGSSGPQNGSSRQIYALRDSSEPHVVFVRGNACKLLGHTGQVTRSITLPEPCEREPLLAGDRMLWTGTSGVHSTPLNEAGVAIDPWRFPQVAEQEQRSDYEMVAATADEFLVLEDRRRLIKLTVREEPRRHLAETSDYSFDDAVVGWSPDGEQLLATTSDHQLLRIDIGSLSLSGTTDLGALPTTKPHLAGAYALVEIEGKRIDAYPRGGGGQPSWSLSLGTSPLSIPVFSLDQDRLLLSQHDGTLLIVSAATGEELGRIQLQSAVCCEPVRRSDVLTLGLESGSVLSLPLSQFAGGAVATEEAASAN